MTNRTCEQCGSPFEVSYPSTRQRFCSSACRVAAVPRPDNTGRHHTEHVAINCPCGKSFEVAPNVAKGGRKFCSPPCAKKFQRKRVAAVKEAGVGRGNGAKKSGPWLHLRGEPRTDPSGYVWVYLRPGDRPAGWKSSRYPEHRQVMRDILGRDLLPGENVHHKNGVKGDNDPANLELWIDHQPKGGRVEDLLTWAHELIARYET